MVWTQLDREAVRVGVVVAARELPHNFLRLGIEQTHAEINRSIVVEDANLCSLGRILSFNRIALGKVPFDRSLHPCGVVKIAVESNLFHSSYSVKNMGGLTSSTLGM